MKKAIALLICLCFIFSTFVACNHDDQQRGENNVNTPEDENTEDSNSENDENKEENKDPDDENKPGDSTDSEIVDTRPVLDLTGVEPIRYTTLEEDYQYLAGGDGKLSKFLNEPKESFLGVCKYLEDMSYELYGYNELGNVCSATYTRGSVMMHVYWVGGELNELSIVNSRKGGMTLPAAIPEVTSGKNDTVVTQMRATEDNPKTQINGMGYVIRLADGSFIVYDGGYRERASELWDTLTTLNGGEEGIVIRAWLLTHAHGDHTYCFYAFSELYANKVTLERVLVAPTSLSDWKMDLNNGRLESATNKFKNAEILYVHTGMVFNFCDVKMEILCTVDDIYFDGSSDDHNNSSIVSRVYKEGGKSVIFLGDAGDDVSTRLIPMYGEYLKSDICQAAHHGVEDFTVEAYRLIRAAIWFYPCNTSLYNQTNRDAEVRQEIKDSEYAEHIYLHDRRTRPVVSLNP